MKRTSDAVAIIRTIRDAHYEQLQGKSNDEIIVFFEERASRLFHSLEKQIQAQQEKSVEDISSR
jgi:hypothetical protein